MAHGNFHGITHGDIHGIKHGGLTLGINATKDATSGVFVPQNASEWASVMAGAGIASGSPANAWNLQEASGNMTDFLGARNLTATGVLTYQQPVTGWTRLGIKSVDASSTQYASTAIPAMNGASAMLLQYVSFNTVAPIATRGICYLGFNTVQQTQFLTSGKLNSRSGGNNAAGNTVYAAGAVIPILTRYNLTGTSFFTYTKDEVLAPTWNTSSGTTLIVVGDHTSACDCTVMYAAFWTGPSAEITQAQGRSLIRTLGNGLWSPP